MLRDKDYLRTNDGLIFNVIGYEHEPGRATANLKYVGGTKWAGGYKSAVDFLSKQYPCYVTDRISVPESFVTEVYKPQSGLRRIIARPDRNHLEQMAVDLVRQCSEFFDVPLPSFGITDSLLWGRGRDGSDVDLVIYGTNAASHVLDRIGWLFGEPGFERHTAETYTRQAAAQNEKTRQLAARKENKGLYQGVRFSLRAVREYEEIEPAGTASPEPFQAVGPIELSAKVEDHSQSLFFPATYKMDAGPDVVSFLMQYEGVFRPGDAHTITGTLERGATDRVVVGSLHGKRHRIALDSALSRAHPTTG